MKLLMMSVSMVMTVASLYPSPATSASITEALHILKNRRYDLTEYINALKKELVDIHATATGKQSAPTLLSKSKKEYYPLYISHLEALNAYLDTRIKDLAKDTTQEEALASAVKKTRDIKEKTDSESRILTLFTDIQKLKSTETNLTKRIALQSIQKRTKHSANYSTLHEQLYADRVQTRTQLKQKLAELASLKKSWKTAASQIKDLEGAKDDRYSKLFFIKIR